MTKKINFAIRGTLQDFFGRKIPTFSRRWPIFIERDLNSSIDLVPIASHDPAIYEDGSFVVAPEITNLLTYSDDLSNPVWIPGSNVFIRSDIRQREGGVSIRQDVDAIATIAGRPGQNEKTQVLRRQIFLEAGKTYTAWALIRLDNGFAGTTDVFRVVQNGHTIGQASLAETLNDAIGKTRAIEIQFEPQDSEQEVNLEFYIENSLTLHVTGVQIEARDFRTFFVYQQNTIETVEQTVLYYHQSPLESLDTFGVLASIKYWRGCGSILKSGDFQVEIDDDRLMATVGSVKLTVSDPLPESFDFFVQVASESQSVAIYIDGKLKAKTNTAGVYRAARAPLTLTSNGVRCYKHIVCTEGLYEDGRVEVNQLALKDVKRLFETDPVPTELLGLTFQNFLAKPVTVPAARRDELNFLVPGYVAVRMPFVALDPLKIEKVYAQTQEVQVGSSLAFKPGRAFIQSQTGADIRTVNAISVSDATRRIKLDTVELVEVGHTIAQPTENGEVLVPYQAYDVRFLYNIPEVSLVHKYNDGIILRNISEEDKTVVAQFIINL